MAEMRELKLPQAHPVLRNGEAVVELRQEGVLVGEVNFTKIMTNWLETLGVLKKPKLTSVP